MSEIKNNLLSSNINLDGVELMDLFQIAHHLKLTSIIKIISSSNETGYVLFENGEVTHSKIDNRLFAEDAFQEILTWSNYNVRNFKYDKKESIERNINVRFEIFLLNTLRKIDEKAAMNLSQSSGAVAEKTQEKEIVSVYELEKINEFCRQQHKTYSDVLSISVLDIKDKNIIGLSCKKDDHKQVIQDISNYLFSIGVNENIHNIENILNGSTDQQLFSDEFYISGDIFQVSKSLSDKFLVSLTWESEVNKIIALKTVRNVSLELEKVL